MNAQLAVLSTPLAAPVIAAAKLRRGNVSSASGSARLLARALATARAAAVSCRVMVRADSAYFNHAFISTARRAGAWFSVTARMNPAVKAAITSIDPNAWTPIKYPKAVWDDQLEQWVSDAEVAEIDFVAFTSKKKRHHVACRLVVRRVKRHQRLASDGTEQGELFAAYRHHAFVTNSTREIVEADARHRDHAIIEQVIAELKDGALAHLWEVHRERSLAFTRRDRVQHRPRSRCRDRGTEDPLGDPARTDHQDPSPSRVDRPATDPAPAPRLALGIGLAIAVGHRDTAAHDLTLSSTPTTTKDPSGRTGTRPVDQQRLCPQHRLTPRN